MIGPLESIVATVRQEIYPYDAYVHNKEGKPPLKKDELDILKNLIMDGEACKRTPEYMGYKKMQDEKREKQRLLKKERKDKKKILSTYSHL